VLFPSGAGGGMERGPPPRIRGIHARTPGHEQPDQPLRSTPRRLMERGAAMLIGCVHVDAALDQFPDERFIWPRRAAPDLG
jgi:hypothetical protein